MTARPIGVLLASHGTVDDLERMGEFLANIRRGRPAPAEMVAEVKERYEAIGGSPLYELTLDQAAALSKRLGLPCYVAQRMWHPNIEETVAHMAADGIKTICSLPLAPNSVHIYNGLVEKAAAEHGLAVLSAKPWNREPALVKSALACINEGLEGMSAKEKTHVLLSAHSLPMRALAAGDPYQTQFEALCAEVGKGLDELGVAWSIAYQSQGFGGGEWLGPTLEVAMANARQAGAEELLFAPIGFLSDHVEVLYDLDVEAKARGEKLGFTGCKRVPSFNAREDFIDALESAAQNTLQTG